MLVLFSLALAVLLSAGLYHKSVPALPKGRHWLLLFLRSLTLFILFLFLFSPVFSFLQTEKRADKILILRDVSNSMQLKTNGISKATLMEEKLKLLKESYSQKGYKIEEHSFADGLKGGKDNSLLSKSIGELASKRDLSQFSTVLLASDGWLKDEDFSLVQRLGLPIVALADTNRYPISDLKMLSLKANRYAYRNEQSLFRAEVLSEGYSGPAALRLNIADKAVMEKKIGLKDGEIQYVDFLHTFKQLGFFAYSVEIVPLAKEQRISNNLILGAIEVLSEKELIMVFSDAPAWDNKFILDAIGANPRWDKKAYQFKDGTLYQGENRAELSSKSQPAAIVIINNGNLKATPEFAGFIRAKLKEGCGLFYQGLPDEALADILPLNASNIQASYQGFVRLSDRAANYPMLNSLSRELSKLPPLDYYYLKPSAGAEVLGTMNNLQNSPAIAVSQDGRYRAISLSFLNLWRWQLKSADKAYERFIIDSLTWLSNKALGSFSAIYKNSYLFGEEIEIRLRAEDDVRKMDLDKHPRITIFNSGGDSILEDFMLKQDEEYSFKFAPKEPGAYSFEIKDLSSDKKEKGHFLLAEELAEDRDYDYNLSLLTFLALDTGGRLLPMEVVDSYSPPQATIQEFKSGKEYAFYKKWYILSLFILSFALELLFRRLWGLL